MFEVDPDKPNIPALARILSGMGILLLVASVLSLFFAFSGYVWINEIYAMVGSVIAFLVALLVFAQAKILEALAVISARVKSRFAIEGAVQKLQSGATQTPNTAWAGPSAPRAQKERVIHVPEDQARQSGFKTR